MRARVLECAQAASQPHSKSTVLYLFLDVLPTGPRYTCTFVLSYITRTCTVHVHVHVHVQYEGTFVHFLLIKIKLL